MTKISLRIQIILYKSKRNQTEIGTSFWENQIINHQYELQPTSLNHKLIKSIKKRIHLSEEEKKTGETLQANGLANSPPYEKNAKDQKDQKRDDQHGYGNWPVISSTATLSTYSWRCRPVILGTAQHQCILSRPCSFLCRCWYSRKINYFFPATFNISSISSEMVMRAVESERTWWSIGIIGNYGCYDLL